MAYSRYATEMKDGDNNIYGLMDEEARAQLSDLNSAISAINDLIWEAGTYYSIEVGEDLKKSDGQYVATRKRLANKYEPIYDTDITAKTNYRINALTIEKNIITSVTGPVSNVHLVAGKHYALIVRHATDTTDISSTPISDMINVFLAPFNVMSTDQVYKYTNGVYIKNSHCEFEEGAAYGITDYIDVSSFETIDWNSYVTGFYIYLTTYDADRKVIASYYNSSNPRAITISGSVKYVRASFYKPNAENKAVLKSGDTILFRYVPGTDGEIYEDYADWKTATNEQIYTQKIYDVSLFDYESGKRISNENGTVTADPDYGLSTYLDVSECKKVIWTPGIVQQSVSPYKKAYLEQLNASKQHLSGWTNSAITREIAINSSAKYIKASFYLNYDGAGVIGVKASGEQFTLFAPVSSKRMIIDHEERITDIEKSTGSTAPEVSNESLAYPKVLVTKKSKQYTSLKWTPQGNVPIKGTNNYFTPYVERTGVLYSDAIEYEKIIGADVSVRTFMTAVHNPYSVLYTENINATYSKSDYGVIYHGDANGGAYLGTACNHHVMRCLGCRVPYSSYNIVRGTTERKLFHKIYNQHATGLEIGDIIGKEGHVMIVIGLARDTYGIVTSVTYSEAVAEGVVERTVTASAFDRDILGTEGYQIYRYTELYKNIEYVPNQFSPIDGETETEYQYNDDICMFAGDYSCYCEGDLICVNYTKAGYTQIEIYRNDVLLETLDLASSADTHVLNLTAKNYTYGKYKARLKNGLNYSDYTYFQIVDASVSLSNGVVTFSSHNGVPVWSATCDAKGYCGVKHEVTSEEATQGYFAVDISFAASSYPYLKVVFACDYGQVQKRISRT